MMGPLEREDQGIYLVTVSKESSESFHYKLNLNVKVGVLHKVILLECPTQRQMMDRQREIYCEVRVKHVFKTLKDVRCLGCNWEYTLTCSVHCNLFQCSFDSVMSTFLTK